MEVQQPSFSPFEGLSHSRMRILEDIKSLGFERQNLELYNLGYTKLSQNIRYLKIHQGDIQAIVSALGQKQPKKDKMQIEGDNVFVADIKNQDRKREKREKKEKAPREKHQEAYLKDYTEWPTDVDRVYLDGNNMLYVEDAIRKLALRRSKKGAEKALTDLAIEFSKAAGIKDVVLVFDSTNLTSAQKVQTAEGKEASFSVVSAAPQFKIADDALVSWSEGELKNGKKCLFVTSDRGLQVRLSEQGVENIMKTKKWFGFVKSSLGEERYQANLAKHSD